MIIYVMVMVMVWMMVMVMVWMMVVMMVMMIVGATFIICRIHPKRAWHTPLICNALGIIISGVGTLDDPSMNTNTILDSCEHLFTAIPNSCTHRCKDRKKKARNERILIIASGILMLSILLMFATLPGILSDKSPNANPRTAGLALSAAALIRLVFLTLFLKFIRNNRLNSKNRKGEYLGIGIALAVIGIIYMDGAFAFLSHQNMLFFSILMFGSTACDMVAYLMLIILFFLKPQRPT